MRFTAVDANVIKRCPRKKLKAIFTEFIRMNVKAAKVDFTEFDYNSVISAYNNLQRGAKVHCVPVMVIKRKNEIYFVRTDI